MSEGVAYFDRQGQPIDLKQWADHFGDLGYRFVAKTTLPNGRWVATIWVGHDLMLISPEPYIFETTVFDGPPRSGKRKTLTDRQYRTEAEAFAGHAELVKEWSEK